jgi:hypothetical protein
MPYVKMSSNSFSVTYYLLLAVSDAFKIDRHKFQQLLSNSYVHFQPH